jgi:fructose 1,6-bisphosphate aldolase/phosphatase
MPVPVFQANTSRFDGPTRVIALGFQLAHDYLIGPCDLFNDPSFNEVRRLCNTIADHMRRHGPFEPHRLPMDEMDCTTLPLVMEKLRDRWEPMPG